MKREFEKEGGSEFFSAVFGSVSSSTLKDWAKLVEKVNEEAASVSFTRPRVSANKLALIREVDDLVTAELKKRFDAAIEASQQVLPAEGRRILRAFFERHPFVLAEDAKGANLTLLLAFTEDSSVGVYTPLIGAMLDSGVEKLDLQMGYEQVSSSVVAGQTDLEMLMTFLAVLRWHRAGGGLEELRSSLHDGLPNRMRERAGTFSFKPVVRAFAALLVIGLRGKDGCDFCDAWVDGGAAVLIGRQLAPEAVGAMLVLAAEQPQAKPGELALVLRQLYDSKKGGEPQYVAFLLTKIVGFDLETQAWFVHMLPSSPELGGDFYVYLRIRYGELKNDALKEMILEHFLALEPEARAEHDSYLLPFFSGLSIHELLKVFFGTLHEVTSSYAADFILIYHKLEDLPLTDEGRQALLGHFSRSDDARPGKAFYRYVLTFRLLSGEGDLDPVLTYGLARTLDEFSTFMFGYESSIRAQIGSSKLRLAVQTFEDADAHLLNQDLDWLPKAIGQWEVAGQALTRDVALYLAGKFIEQRSLKDGLAPYGTLLSAVHSDGARFDHSSRKYIGLEVVERIHDLGFSYGGVFSYLEAADQPELAEVISEHSRWAGDVALRRIVDPTYREEEAGDAEDAALEVAPAPRKTKPEPVVSLPAAKVSPESSSEPKRLSAEEALLALVKMEPDFTKAGPVVQALVPNVQDLKGQNLVTLIDLIGRFDESVLNDLKVAVLHEIRLLAILGLIDSSLLSHQRAAITWLEWQRMSPEALDPYADEAIKKLAVRGENTPRANLRQRIAHLLTSALGTPLLEGDVVDKVVQFLRRLASHGLDTPEQIKLMVSFAQAKTAVVREEALKLLKEAMDIASIMPTTQNGIERSVDRSLVQRVVTVGKLVEEANGSAERSIYAELLRDIPGYSGDNTWLPLDKRTRGFFGSRVSAEKPWHEMPADLSASHARLRSVGEDEAFFDSLERLSMHAVIGYHMYGHGKGYQRFVTDVSADGRVGHDLLVIDFRTGDIWRVEVKGKDEASGELKISRHEALTAKRTAREEGVSYVVHVIQVSKTGHFWGSYLIEETSTLAQKRSGEGFLEMEGESLVFSLSVLFEDAVKTVP